MPSLSAMRDLDAVDPLPGLGERAAPPSSSLPAPTAVRLAPGSDVWVGVDGKWETRRPGYELLKRGPSFREAPIKTAADEVIDRFLETMFPPRPAAPQNLPRIGSVWNCNGHCVKVLDICRNRLDGSLFVVAAKNADGTHTTHIPLPSFLSAYSLP
jgi:hypothetical protein